MTTYEIERLLRRPAPDEPAILPALILPSAAVGFGGVRIRPRAAGVRTGFVSPRLLFAVLALVGAMISAIASGAIRLDRLPNPFAPNAGFGGRGVTLDFPKEWQVVAALSPFNDQGGWTTLILSNAGVDGCSIEEVGTETLPVPVKSGDVYVVEGDQTGAIHAPEDRIYECVIGRPMTPGEIRLVLTQGPPQRVGVGPFGDFDVDELYGPAGLGGFGFTMPTREDGWTQLVDGLPAKLVVRDASVTPGADEVRTWLVHSPDVGLIWFVQSVLRGPDLDVLRTQADTVAQSLRFDSHPPALDVATRDAALAKALDRADREWREFRGSRFFGCFPRTPGEREVVLTEGPGGPLLVPARVTCTTKIAETPLSLWRAVAVVSWVDGQGVPAGSWGWELLFDANGKGSASGDLFDNHEVEFPGAAGGELPPPLDGPLVIPIGSLVQVLPPGIVQDSGPIEALYEHWEDSPFGDRIVNEASAGRRFSVLDGPLSYLGSDWYLVQSQVGTSYPGEHAWLPATDGDQPLIGVVDASCPIGDLTVTDLVYMHPAERLQCFGDRELALDPAIAELAEPNPGGEVAGTPEWLAKDTFWRLYGSGGPDGVDGPLAVVISPSLGDSIPTGAWLTVRGHFDDAASATCQRTFPEEWGAIPESAETQRLLCREQFVVTSIEPRSAP